MNFGSFFYYFVLYEDSFTQEKNMCEEKTRKVNYVYVSLFHHIFFLFQIHPILFEELLYTYVETSHPCSSKKGLL